MADTDLELVALFDLRGAECSRESVREHASLLILPESAEQVFVCLNVWTHVLGVPF